MAIQILAGMLLAGLEPVVVVIRYRELILLINVGM